MLRPTRRHATTPWKGESVVLVAYTVNTLGKELERECQGLEALGFPLPASVRLPLTEQQDVRRLDAIDCCEEEPLQEVEARQLERNLEAGTVELEVSWNFKHTPDQQRAQSQHALLACQPFQTRKQVCIWAYSRLTTRTRVKPVRFASLSLCTLQTWSCCLTGCANRCR